jgi:hypothetical protein
MTFQNRINQTIVGTFYRGFARGEVEYINYQNRKGSSVYSPLTVEKIPALKRPSPTQFGFNTNIRDFLDSRIQRQTIDFLHNTKTNVLRVEIPFTYLSKENGKVNWNDINKMMNTLDFEDIKIIAVLGDWIDGTHKPPKLELFNPYVYRFASAYGEQVVGYEIGNEPNHIPFWKGTSIDYARLAKNAYHIIKDIDENSQVGINVCRLTEINHRPWPFIFLDQLHKENAVDLFDFIGVHGYPGTWEFGNASSWYKYLLQTNSWMSDNDVFCKMWVTETGTTASKWGKITGHTAEHQKDFTIEVAEIMKMLEIEIVSFYRALDLNKFSDSEPQKYLPQEHYFGLQDKFGKSKLDGIEEVLAETFRNNK